jgi:acyl-coenzyme A synthetase/AMP-(fatty) acid ligase
VLVTTPVHLRALVASATSFPAVELIVSATAPLSGALARDSERRFDAPLREIYGSTETGEMALRRTAHDPLWELWPGVRLEPADGGYAAEGGHIETPVVLQDVVEPVGARHFLLQGRRTDLVNIAGRRSSLSYLNHQLQSVPGVVDGAFVMRAEDADEGGVVRLAALVVAPDLSVAQLMEALRQRIDAAFLPRPLLRVEQLPRNATGKLPLAAVEDLLLACREREPAGRRPA